MLREHTEVILLAFLVLFLVFGLVAVRGARLWRGLGGGGALELLQPGFDLIDQPNIFVVFHHPRSSLVVLHGGLFFKSARAQIKMTQIAQLHSRKIQGKGDGEQGHGTGHSHPRLSYEGAEGREHIGPDLPETLLPAQFGSCFKGCAARRRSDGENVMNQIGGRL